MQTREASAVLGPHIVRKHYTSNLNHVSYHRRFQSAPTYDEWSPSFTGSGIAQNFLLHRVFWLSMKRKKRQNVIEFLFYVREKAVRVLLWNWRRYHETTVGSFQSLPVSVLGGHRRTARSGGWLARRRLSLLGSCRGSSRSPHR